MDERRILHLIRLLDWKNAPVPGAQLCEELNITTRTLRNDIRESKAELREHGIEIGSVHAVGYYLEILDEDRYYQYINQKLKEEADRQLVIPIYSEERAEYLIRKFLTASDFIKMEDICDELYISRSTLTNDLKEVRERLKYFHLELESRLSVFPSDKHDHVMWKRQFSIMEPYISIYQFISYDRCIFFNKAIE
ncbi:MAG: helix-turn-helix domain-containing protein [Solobacterium sp.]|nr:helix-turn-helix domain-containing protein [Solobacterium sp.]